jgi:hypothetical protein
LKLLPRPASGKHLPPAYKQNPACRNGLSHSRPRSAVPAASRRCQPVRTPAFPRPEVTAIGDRFEFVRVQRRVRYLRNRGQLRSDPTLVTSWQRSDDVRCRPRFVGCRQPCRGRSLPSSGNRDRSARSAVWARQERLSRSPSAASPLLRVREFFLQPRLGSSTVSDGSPPAAARRSAVSSWLM